LEDGVERWQMSEFVRWKPQSFATRMAFLSAEGTRFFSKLNAKVKHSNSQ
jgi:hypothetical protein